VDDDNWTKIWRRTLSAIWWFRLPIVPYALYVGLFAAIIVVCSVIFRFFFPGPHHEIIFFVIDNFMVASSAVLTMWMLFRFAEHRKMKRSGFDTRFAVRDMLVGFVLGILLVSSVVGVLWFIGVYEFVKLTPGYNPVPFFFVYLFAAITEEVIFRGFVFQTAEIRLGTKWAFVITCLLFGLAHMSNSIKGITAVDQMWGCVCLMFEAGILLNASFLVRRTLWLPIGLHWAWNFFEGPIYGMSVSGTDASGLIQAQLVGDKLLSGGSFGPEASVPALGLCTLAGFGMLYYVRARGREREEAKKMSLENMMKKPPS
jgi:hypothetical protein